MDECAYSIASLVMHAIYAGQPFIRNLVYSTSDNANLIHATIAFEPSRVRSITSAILCIIVESKKRFDLRTRCGGVDQENKATVSGSTHIPRNWLQHWLSQATLYHALSRIQSKSHSSCEGLL
jgi:hypothetical protein